MRKTTHRAVRKLAQGHTTEKQHSWDLNLGSLAPESTPLATSVSCVSQ